MRPTHEGAKEIPIKGGATKLNLQHNFVNFRPSLSDPLRPDVLQVTAPGMSTASLSTNESKGFLTTDQSQVWKTELVLISQIIPDTQSRLRNFDKFMSPHEFTPIDTAVVGQKTPVVGQKPQPDNYIRDVINRLMKSKIIVVCQITLI